MPCAAPEPSLLAALEQLGAHDHLCSIYETEDEQYAVAIPFIRIGLERREKCVYIADDHHVSGLHGRLRQAGVDVEAALRSGALVVLTKKDAYLRNGRFDPEWMFTFWREAAAEAKAQGFGSLRGTGETEWVLRGAPGMERWMEYESRLTRAMAETDCFALCQYNSRLFPPQVILDVIRTHPIVIYRGTLCRNFYYVPAEEFLNDNPAGHEVDRWLTNIRERELIESALREQRDALQQARAELEARVRERTAELTDANRQLQAEILERRQMEETLRDREEWLQLAQKVAGLGIADWNIPANRARFSEQFFRLYGLEPSERTFNFEEWIELVHPDDRERVRRQLRTALEARRPGQAEFRVVWPDGSVHWIGARVSVFHDGQGNAVRLLGTSMDVTERRASEEAQYNAQKLESIGLLAGGVAHDFNNLLTGVLGNASLLQDEVPWPARDKVEAIIHSAEKAADLTRQLLAYAGKGRFMVQRIDLGGMLLRMQDLLRLTVPKSIALQLEPAGSAPEVEADLGQIQQIVVNLVINAAEAIGEAAGGIISISASSLTLDPAQAGRYQPGVEPGSYVALQVDDNGCGMTEATKSRLFEPFFTTKFFGRGLGLPAVAGIVHSYRGAVEVHSEPGKGSSFRILLPALETGVPPAVRGARSAAGIMVVDDEPSVREFMQNVLKRRGYRVITAPGGREALSLLEQHADIGLVVLDVIMPGINGGETLRTIKEKKQSVKVLVTSGHDQAEAERLCAMGSADGFIQKPYTARKFAEAVAEVLGRKASPPA